MAMVKLTRTIYVDLNQTFNLTYIICWFVLLWFVLIWN